MRSRARGRWRNLGFLCVLPFTAVLLTYTRGAYVGIVAALIVYAVVRRPRVLLWALPVLVVVYFAAPAGIRDRIRSTTDLSDTTNRDRIAMARAGARMVRDFPVFGLGPEMVKRYYPLYRDPDAPRWSVPHLHDNVIQIAAANGVFAAAAYLALVGLVLARAAALARRGDDPDRAALWCGALLAVAALTVAGLFEYNFGDTEVEMATLLVVRGALFRAPRKRAEIRIPGCFRAPSRFPRLPARTRSRSCSPRFRACSARPGGTCRSWGRSAASTCAGGTATSR